MQLFSQALADGLECDYFYNKAQCDIPDLAAMTHGRFKSQVLIYLPTWVCLFSLFLGRKDATTQRACATNVHGLGLKIGSVVGDRLHELVPA